MRLRAAAALLFAGAGLAVAASAAAAVSAAPAPSSAVARLSGAPKVKVRPKRAGKRSAKPGANGRRKAKAPTGARRKNTLKRGAARAAQLRDAVAAHAAAGSSGVSERATAAAPRPRLGSSFLHVPDGPPPPPRFYGPIQAAPRARLSESTLQAAAGARRRSARTFAGSDGAATERDSEGAERSAASGPSPATDRSAQGASAAAGGRLAPASPGGDARSSGASRDGGSDDDSSGGGAGGGAGGGGGGGGRGGGKRGGGGGGRGGGGGGGGGKGGKDSKDDSDDDSKKKKKDPALSTPAQDPAPIKLVREGGSPRLPRPAARLAHEPPFKPADDYLELPLPDLDADPKARAFKHDGLSWRYDKIAGWWIYWHEGLWWRPDAAAPGGALMHVERVYYKVEPAERVVTLTRARAPAETGPYIEKMGEQLLIHPDGSHIVRQAGPRRDATLYKNVEKPVPVKYLGQKGSGFLFGVKDGQPALEWMDADGKAKAWPEPKG